MSEFEEEWLELKDKRTEVLEKIKESVKGTDLHNEYLEVKVLTDQAFERLIQAKDEVKFNGFIDFQHFMGEFGWSLGLLLYTVFNLIIIFYNSSRIIFGQLFLHIALTFVSLYFMGYATLIGFSDYYPSSYFIANIIIAVLILFSIYHLLKWRDRYFDHNRESKEFIKNATSFISSLEKNMINPKKIKDERVKF